MVALASFVDLYTRLGTFSYTEVADLRANPAYVPKLSAPVSFTRALAEIGVGVMPPQFADVQFSNVNTALGTNGFLYGVDAKGADSGYGDDPYGGTGEVTLSEVLAVEDIRGALARGRIVDLDTSAVFFTIDGVIASPKAGGARAALRIESRHTHSFNQLLPLLRIIDIFPDADLTGAADQDAPVIVPFGTMRKVRLVPVSETTGAYDYGLFRKPTAGTLTLDAIYREDNVVPDEEYSFVERPAGYYVIRFAREQRENGRPWEIRATVSSTEFARHSDVVKWVLLTLGKQVNAASFTTAGGVYATAGYNVPGHGLSERRRAVDILNDLLLRGATLELNSAAEYEITVDSTALHPPATISIGAGDSQWQNADPESVQWEILNETEQIGTLKLLGSFDIGFRGDSSYLVTATQTIPGGTVTQEISCPYIGDGFTLDREASYRAKRWQNSAQALTLTADFEAKDLALGELVPVWIPNDIVNGDTYEVARLAYEATRGGQGEDIEAHFNLTLRRYHPSIFTYTAGVLQVSPGALTLTDYTYTLPEAPTALALVSATPQGTTGVSSVIHSATPPPVNVTDLVFRAVPTGSIIPLAGEAVTPCAPGQVGVSGTLTLAAGLSYTIQCFARNRNNAPGFQDGFITQIFNYVPAGDTTVPPQVTGLGVAPGAYRTLNLVWNSVDPTRLRNYIVQISTNSSFSAIIKNLTPKSNDTTVSGLNNSATYFVRVQAVYNNGIAGAFSATASQTTTLVATPDIGPSQVTGTHIVGNTIAQAHIQANAVGTAQIQAGAIGAVEVQANAIGEVNINANSISTVKIQGSAVTTDKRQPVVTLTGSYDIPPGTAVQASFSHALGRVPLVTVDTNSSSVQSHIFALSSSQIFVGLRNTVVPPSVNATGTVEIFFW